MQRVVVLFVGLLSVVRATPLDPDGVDLPTVLQYNFRIEKGEFGNYAFPENSKHEDEVVTFKSSQNSKRIDESDAGKLKGLKQLFGDLEECDIITMKGPPIGGCIYVANGNVYFFAVIPEVNIEDVYIAFEEAGIGKCKVGEDGFDDVPEESCFGINDRKKSVYWLGVYDDKDDLYESDKVDDIKGLFSHVEKCNLSAGVIPREGCSLFDHNGIHYLNVLIYVKTHDIERSLGELNIPECVYDVELGLITKEPCYLITTRLPAIHFLNLDSKPEDVQEDDNDDHHYIEKTYEIPDEEVSPPSLVQPATGSGNLHQLKFKGLFNQLPVDEKKAKSVLPKKIQSIQELQEIEQKLGRQHGNHRPPWMNYLRTIA